MDKLCTAVIEAIINETVLILPHEIHEFYNNPPGRKPASSTIRISDTVKSIGPSASMEIIAGVVDHVTFAILSLIENNFKQLSISTQFRSDNGSCAAAECRLVEMYRFRVDPGGIIITDK